MSATAKPAGPAGLDQLPPFLTVPEVATVLRLGRSATYDVAVGVDAHAAEGEGDAARHGIAGVRRRIERQRPI